jgi:hypothetical protein
MQKSALMPEAKVDWADTGRAGLGYLATVLAGSIPVAIIGGIGGVAQTLFFAIVIAPWFIPGLVLALMIRWLSRRWLTSLNRPVGALLGLLAAMGAWYPLMSMPAGPVLPAAPLLGLVMPLVGGLVFLAHPSHQPDDGRRSTVQLESD